MKYQLHRFDKHHFPLELIDRANFRTPNPSLRLLSSLRDYAELVLGGAYSAGLHRRLYAVMATPFHSNRHAGPRKNRPSF